MKAKAIFRFISRNETKPTQIATENELLQEVLDELKDALEIDLDRTADLSREEDFEISYTEFMSTVNRKAVQFKQDSHGYRQICSVPPFALALVMASRVQSHYTHARWFRLGSLTEMINVHGTVSEPVEIVAPQLIGIDAVCL